MAIRTAGPVQLMHLDVHENQGILGKSACAISSVHNSLFLLDSRVHHNEASGVYGVVASLTHVRSTIDNNASHEIDVHGVDVQLESDLLLHSSTVSLNGSGDLVLLSSNARVFNSTIADNSGFQLYFESKVPSLQADLEVVGSIIAHDSDLHPAACRTSPNKGEATFISAWTIYSDGSCVSDTFLDNSLHFAKINLSPLADWGGPTATHLSLPGSDAIDRAPGNVCSQLGTDQRGLPRPVSGKGIPFPRCDIGAVELQ